MSFRRYLIAACFALLCDCADARSETLQLDDRESVVDFSFDSQLLSGTGRFTKYDGTFVFDPMRPAASRLELTADPSRVSFSSLPVNQMLVLNTLIKSIPNEVIRFKSDDFTKKSEVDYVISGTTDAGKHSERVALPVVITKSGTGYRVKGVFQRSGSIGANGNPAAALFRSTRCKADFSLLFK